MANTVIQLKNSGTPSSIPSNLANGEIALNYADGKFYYKNTTGHIVSFVSGGGSANSFATINANNSLVTAISNNSILRLVPQQGIGISADIINDIITIDDNLTWNLAQSAFAKANIGGSSSVNVGPNAPVSPTQGNLWWNTNLGRLFIYYTDVDSSQWVEVNPSGDTVNSSGSGSGSDPVAYGAANAAFDKANSANVLAYNTGIGANAWTNTQIGVANTWANSVGAAGNNYANATFYTTTNGSAAFSTANIANAQANNISIDTEMKGFLDQIETYIRFDSTTNVFTLAANSTSWSYWDAGRRYTVTGNSTVIIPGGNPLPNGNYYITIQNNGLGTLTASSTAWDLSDPATLSVSYVKFNNYCTPKYFLAEERHTVLMDSRTHRYLHFTRGTQVQQFGTLTGYTVNGTANVNNIFDISKTILNDEDIILTIDAKTTQVGNANNYFVFHRYTTGGWAWLKNDLPFKYTTGGFIEYDNAATMTQVANNKYVNSYLVFTNLDQGAGFAIIPGRSTYNSVVEAQAEDATQFDMTGFGVLESVIAYQLTWHTDDTLTTNGKCQLADTPRRIGTAISTVAPVYSTGLHNDLGGLQGGKDTEYYHLTAAEYTSLQGNSQATIANSYAVSVGASSNAWANTVGVTANNYAGTMANASNGYANSTFYTSTNGTAAFAKANTASVVGSNAAIEFIIDGGGSVITTGTTAGIKGYLEIPFNCTINQWTMLLDQTGSANVEIWKDTYANFPPTNADTINASGFVVTSAVKGQGTSITTTTINAGDILAYNVATVATATRITISLKVTKT